MKKFNVLMMAAALFGVSLAAGCSAKGGASVEGGGTVAPLENEQNKKSSGGSASGSVSGSASGSGTVQ